MRSIAFPDNTPATNLDNPRQIYSYATNTGWTGTAYSAVDSSYPLGSITDEKGVVFANWTYDFRGRVLTSSHIGSTDTYTFAYDDVLLKTTVTNPLGRSTEYKYSQINGGIKRLEQVDGIATTSCAASDTDYLHDANGFRSQATDAEGRIITWTRNSRGLPTTTVEGSGTSSARTTSATWHATRAVPTQIVVPNVTTNITYNTDGQVAQVSEVDTTSTTSPYSTNGQTRTTLFGYTAFGGVAPPAVGPTSTALTDVSLSIVNSDASAANTDAWTNSTGAIIKKIDGKCLASACFSSSAVARSVAYQDITIPTGNIAEVDALRRSAFLQWSQASNLLQGDPASMRVVFLNASNAVIGSGPATVTQINDWKVRTLDYPVPALTRKIRVIMMFERTFGSANDGYIDNISLKLKANGTASATPFLTVANASAEATATTSWTAVTGTVAKSTANPCALFPCFSEGTRYTDAISQVIDIPTDRNTEIDNNARRIEVAWLEYGKVNYSKAALEITFLNASSVALPDGLRKTVPQTAIDKWVERTAAYDVPAGTRKIKLALVFPGADDVHKSKTYATGIKVRLIGRLAAPAPVNLLTSVDGPLAGVGDKVFYAYNTNGSLTLVTNEVGHVTQITAQTANGLPATIRDPNTVDTVLGYNARDWLTSITVNPGASQAVTALEYDPLGQITKITEPDGSYLSYTWSDARRLTTITNNSGDKIEYLFNANGDVTTATVKSQSGAIQQQMTLLYDELGRLLRSIGASNQTTEYSYDRTDLQTQVKDPRNNLFGTAYDSLQRVIRETDQEGSQVNLIRNAQDEVTVYQDPRVLVTNYVRNGFGDVIRETSPDAGTTVLLRDLRGLVTQETDGRGVVVNRSYDSAGRLLTETYPAATAENVTYTYDAIAGGNKGIGRLTSMTDQSGSTSYVYDALGRITNNARVIAGKSYVTAYQYNVAGRVSQITYPSGRIVTIGRNALGQVSAVTSKQNATAASVNIATGLTWKPMSDLLSGLTHGNGLVTEAEYDQDYRLWSLKLLNGGAMVSGYNYPHTDNLNLTGITDLVTPANSVSLWYSPANRLQNADGPWGQNSFWYDGVGNRTFQSSTFTGITTERNLYYSLANNRLGDIWENGAALRTYSYDGAGNTATETRPSESFTYGYNNRNRLTTVTRNGVAYASYGYNGMEQMTSRSTSAIGGPTGTVHYV